MWAGWLSLAAYAIPGLVEKVVGYGSMFVNARVNANGGGRLGVALSALSNSSVGCSIGSCFSMTTMVFLGVVGNSRMLTDVLPGLV